MSSPSSCRSSTRSCSRRNTAARSRTERRAQARCAARAASYAVATSAFVDSGSSASTSPVNGASVVTVPGRAPVMTAATRRGAISPIERSGVRLVSLTCVVWLLCAGAASRTLMPVMLPASSLPHNPRSLFKVDHAATDTPVNRRRSEPRKTESIMRVTADHHEPGEPAAGRARRIGVKHDRYRRAMPTNRRRAMAGLAPRRDHVARRLRRVHGRRGSCHVVDDPVGLGECHAGRPRAGISHGRRTHGWHRRRPRHRADRRGRHGAPHDQDAVRRAPALPRRHLSTGWRRSTWWR